LFDQLGGVSCTWARTNGLTSSKHFVSLSRNLYISMTSRLQRIKQLVNLYLLLAYDFVHTNEPAKVVAREQRERSSPEAAAWSSTSPTVNRKVCFGFRHGTRQRAQTRRCLGPHETRAIRTRLSACPRACRPPIPLQLLQRNCFPYLVRATLRAIFSEPRVRSEAAAILRLVLGRGAATSSGTGVPTY
jgi:hypothetical protein